MSTSAIIPLVNPDARDASGGSRTHSGRRSRDRKTVERLLRRDPAAWQTFVESSQRLIYSRVLATGRELGREIPADLAEDCAAEVMQALLKDDMSALRRFEGRSKLTTWLAVIARRVTLAKLTRKPTIDEQARKPDSRFDLSYVSDRREGPVGELTAEADQRRLRRCMERLKTSDRVALSMHFEDRSSYREIGRALSISENAVGPKLKRAQRRLRKLWESDKPEEDK